MFEFWRDLCAACFAWLLGILAVHYYPRPFANILDSPLDYLTMVMFQPYGVLLTGICLALASYILYSLIMHHGKQMIIGRIGSAVYQFLHVLLFFFCIYILWIQGQKFPSSTIFLILVFIIYSLRKVFYNAALRIRMIRSRHHKK